MLMIPKIVDLQKKIVDLKNGRDVAMALGRALMRTRYWVAEGDVRLHDSRGVLLSVTVGWPCLGEQGMGGCVDTYVESLKCTPSPESNTTLLLLFLCLWRLPLPLRPPCL